MLMFLRQPRTLEKNEKPKTIELPAISGRWCLGSKLWTEQYKEPTAICLLIVK